MDLIFFFEGLGSRGEIWPPRRKRTVLWLHAQVTVYRKDGNQSSSLLEYMEYARGQKATLYTHHHRRKLVAIYLIVADEPT
jgi:hypothetical protein